MYVFVYCVCKYITMSMSIRMSLYELVYHVEHISSHVEIYVGRESFEPKLFMLFKLLLHLLGLFVK